MTGETSDIEKLIDTLLRIGLVKHSLPFRYRGWANELGLFVQVRSVSLGTKSLEDLKAGGKSRPCLVAERSVSGSGNWELKKFDRNRWEHHFAHLVKPTSEIALILNFFNHGGFTEERGEALLQAIQHFKKTGEWHDFDTWPVFAPLKQQWLKQQLDEKAANSQIENHPLSDTKPTPTEVAMNNGTGIAVGSFADHLRKALEYRIHGKYDDSIMEYSKAIAMASNSAIAYFSRGEIFLTQGKRVEAIADFEKVVSLAESPELTRTAQKHIDELKSK